MTRVEYVCGIDGGGSGCRVRLCDPDGCVLVEAEGGAANFTTNPDGAIRNVLDAVRQAKANLSDDNELGTGVAHVGLAGVMDKSDAGTIAAAMPFAHTTVTDDRATSVAGALGASDGVVVSVGTGSFVAAQSGGSQQFLGGWGLMLGDQASGAWLGVQALQRAVLADEGLAVQSGLTRDLMQDNGGTTRGLLTFVSEAKPSDYAGLAPKIVEAACNGDFHGKALMQEGARYLMSCLHQIKIADHTRICLTGGVGPHYADYLAPEVRPLIQPPQGTALEGAVHLARRLL